MGLLDDIMKALDRIPVWKKLQGVPDQVADLERRVAELEAELNKPLSEKSCPSCGKQTFFVVGSDPDRTFKSVGGLQRHYQCRECGYQEDHLWYPGIK